MDAILQKIMGITIVIFMVGNLLEVEWGTGFDLVMQIYGELNVFRPGDAELILRKAHVGLNEEGLLLLEVQDFTSVQRAGETPPRWYSSRSGLFSDSPYLHLGETFWDAERHTMMERMYILDAQCAEVNLFAQTYQAYSDADYAALFERCGFHQVQFYPAMGGDLSKARGDFFPIVGRKNSMDA